MKKWCISLKVFSALFLIMTGSTYEARGQSDYVRGTWSGTVKMKQEYTGELGHSVLEITTTFRENIGSGSMNYEAESRGHKASCSGSGQAELHELAISISEDNNTYNDYYIAIVGPDYTCVNGEEWGQSKRDITISGKVLISNSNILSGTQTETRESGAGPVTTTLTWHLVTSTDIDEPCIACGSVIGIENQSLGQAIAITGAPFSLHYRSDRLPGTGGALDIGNWTFNVHHTLWGPRLELGDGRQRNASDNLGALKAVENEIPGIVPASGYLVSSRDGVELYSFESGGRHLRTLDALTGALIYEFQYNVKGQLVAIVDAYGQATTIVRSASGLPISIVTPYGQRTDLVLDSKHNLVSTINAAGEKNSFVYSSTGLLTNMIDAHGFSHSYEYDASGRLIKDIDPAGGFTSLSQTSNANGHTISVSTALRRIGSYSVVKQTGGVQKRVVTFSDGSKNTGITSPDGHRTVEFGDGTVVKLINKPDKRWGNQASLPALTVKLPSGLESTLDVARNTTLANPSNPLSLTGFTQTHTVNGRALTIKYVASNRTITIALPSGRNILATLDANGRVTEAQAGRLAPVRVIYDNNGRPIVLEQGPVDKPRRYRLTYNSAGYLNSITDPLAQTSNFLYDAAGRVTQTTLPDGRILMVQYDAMGNMKAFTPGGRPAHKFEYDATNHVTKYEPPNVSSGKNVTRYEYNADHQVTRIIRSDGEEINLAYDPAGCSCGKLSSLVTASSGKINLTYHPTTGKLIGMTSPGGTKLAQTYDGPLLMTETWNGPITGSVTRRYNSDYQVAAHTVNGGQAIAYVYDRDGLLTQAGDLVLTRSTLNSLISSSTSSGVKENWMYNDFGEITRSEAVFKETTLLVNEYTRDDLGRIITKHETIGGVANDYGYGYDLAGRLVTVTKNGVTISSYSYDSNDNRLSVITPNGTTTGTYDDQDRIVLYGNTSYAFTDNGEMFTRTAPSETTTYKYDAFGNLLRVNLPGPVIEYLVDGRNRRIGKKVNGTLVQGFVYEDGLRIAAELDGNGRVVSRFVYGTRYNVPDYMIRDGVKYRIIADHLGSPRLIVDVQTGTIAQRMDYDEFGNVLTDSRPGFQPFGFAGGLYDHDTKLARFGLRDYDAGTGRWTTKDPIRFRGMSSNFYQYVAGDPVNRTDPLGLQTELPDNDEQVCSWDAGKKKAKRELKALDSFRGTNGQRYGMETEGGHEIDLRHYTAAYNTAQRLGGKGSYYAFWASQFLGLGMECSQWKADSKSAFNSSDFLSNFIGALDAFQGNTPIAGTPSGPYGFLSF